MAKVVVENLIKDYREANGTAVRAVNGINLEVAPGEFMVLVGPSGCGKSSTLRMIAGLEETTGGTITIDGRTMDGVLPKDRDIAMVFQNYALYPHMTVYDNMAFGLKLRGLPKAEIEARVRDAAALLGIEEFFGRRPKALSGGQRQRVAVGRAIVRKPKVFLFDEPLSNLDAKMRAATRAEIAKLHARLGATMIYVTHDQVEAMTMGDRICVMQGGNIMQVAGPLEIYRRPANVFVAGFIGSPPMNLFPGVVRREARGTVFIGEPSAGALTIPLDGEAGRKAAAHADKPVILGLRPEDVHDAAEPGLSGAASVEAMIELAEPMGAETHLHLSAAGATFVGRLRGALRYEVNRRLRVAFDVARAHLFERAGGAALAHFQEGD